VSVEQVGQAYSSVADLYIELFGTTGKVHPDDLAFIERHLSIRSGTVLDLGCGPGHLTGHLHGLGVDALGLDVVPEFVAHARAAHPRVPFRLGSMEKLDVADHSVAGVLAWFSTIHLAPAEIGAQLAEFRRVLAPAGTLVVGFFEAAEVGAFDHKVTTAYHWPVEEMARVLAGAGFTAVESMRRPSDGTHRPYAATAATADPLRRWTVWRQDDNGNRFEVARKDSRDAAERLAAELEARGHKQLYWVAGTAG